ncbi:TetR/AcrR family transcriptional regulator [Tissierella pigra]|uniref:TetR/AcrR family transcriptional regulator n=1 Tax=Tissierella pigra TaxID=2607614 RepID=A0A6N7XSS0_9FIRM|nr:TetR/AcrR family transcriptional regulator [Tissierella pigra]MBU5425343.1 TetR/AcrR family transcriptional regulator [Tissierella pigra]MSU00463.1 TetR/AcrR family transcriptional regulator [Tissierella pigra]
MRDLTSIEEKILDKTLYLIGKIGTFNVPIRTIAKEAGVNVSAINYYFRTKEEMLLLVKEFYIDNTIAAYSILDNDEYDNKEKIILCANEIIEYTLKYPGVLTILKEARSRKSCSEIDAKIVEVTDRMNIKLDKALSNFFNKNLKDFQYNKMIFLSSILYPPLNLDIANFNEKTMGNKEERLKYITYVVDMLNKDN